MATLCTASCTNNANPDAYGILGAESWMVASSEPGRIVRMDLREGQKVRKDEVTVLIDTSQMAIQLKAVESQIASLRQTLPDVGRQMDVLHQQKEALKNEAERIRPLVSSGSASTRQMDKIEDEIRLTESREAAARSSLSRETASVLASISALEAQADVLRDRIDRCSVSNPEDGTVNRIFVKNHEFVSPGMPVYRLCDYENMFVDSWFDAEKLPSIRLGDRVSVVVEDASRESHSLPGTVSFIAEESEFTPNKVMTRDTRAKFVYRVRIDVMNDGSLKAGMPVGIFLQKND